MSTQEWLDQYFESRIWYKCNKICAKDIWFNTEDETEWHSYNDRISRIAVTGINKKGQTTQIGLIDAEFKLIFFDYDCEIIMNLEYDYWIYYLYKDDTLLRMCKCPFSPIEIEFELESYTELEEWKCL